MLITLESERLLLRMIQKKDATQLFTLRTNSIVNTYIGNSNTKNLNDAKQFIQDRIKEIESKKIHYWTICLKGQDKLIGTICLWNYNTDQTIAEIGYGLLPEHFKKGYMTEAINEVKYFAFNTLQLKAIEAYTHKNNLSSRNLLEKSEFLLQEFVAEKEFLDNRVYLIKNFN